MLLFYLFYDICENVDFNWFSHTFIGKQVKSQAIMHLYFWMWNFQTVYPSILFSSNPNCILFAPLTDTSDIQKLLPLFATNQRHPFVAFSDFYCNTTICTTMHAATIAHFTCRFPSKASQQSQNKKTHARDNQHQQQHLGQHRLINLFSLRSHRSIVMTHKVLRLWSQPLHGVTPVAGIAQNVDRDSVICFPSICTLIMVFVVGDAIFICWWYLFEPNTNSNIYKYNTCYRSRDLRLVGCSVNVMIGYLLLINSKTIRLKLLIKQMVFVLVVCFVFMFCILYLACADRDSRKCGKTSRRAGLRRVNVM